MKTFQTHLKSFLVAQYTWPRIDPRSKVEGLDAHAESIVLQDRLELLWGGHGDSLVTPGT